MHEGTRTYRIDVTTAELVHVRGCKIENIALASSPLNAAAGSKQVPSKPCPELQGPSLAPFVEVYVALELSTRPNAKLERRPFTYPLTNAGEVLSRGDEAVVGGLGGIGGGNRSDRAGVNNNPDPLCRKDVEQIRLCPLASVITAPPAFGPAMLAIEAVTLLLVRAWN